MWGKLPNQRKTEFFNAFKSKVTSIIKKKNSIGLDGIFNPRKFKKNTNKIQKLTARVEQLEDSATNYERKTEK